MKVMLQVMIFLCIFFIIINIITHQYGWAVFQVACLGLNLYNYKKCTGHYPGL